MRRAVFLFASSSRALNFVLKNSKFRKNKHTFTSQAHKVGKVKVGLDFWFEQLFTSYNCDAKNGPFPRPISDLRRKSVLFFLVHMKVGIYESMYAKFEKNLTIATLAIKIQSLPKNFTKKFQTRRIFRIMNFLFGHHLELQTMDLWLLHIFFVLPTMCSAEFIFIFYQFWGGPFLKIHFSPGGHRGPMIFGEWNDI